MHSRLLLLSLLLLTACSRKPAPKTAAPPSDARPESAEEPGLPAQAEHMAFLPPRGSGVIDITQPPYNAKGDGITDNTAVLQRAIEDHIQTVKRGATHLYFPEGTYLISDSLLWKNAKQQWSYGLVFQGDGQERTIIKLRDQADGFQNPKNPKAMVVTASRPFANKLDTESYGLGNQGFDNHLYDLTLDTGSGNPGAVALDYNASNIGSIVRVTLRDSGGDAYAGLMINRHVGPAMARDLRIEGFDIGILNDVQRYPNGMGVLMAFERTQILQPRQIGIDHYDTLVFGDLLIEEAPLAIRNHQGRGVLVVENALLRHTGHSAAAIENQGALFLRDIRTEGYTQALQGQAGQKLDELALPEAISLDGQAARSLRLPVPEAPQLRYPSPEAWTLATDLGAMPNDKQDDSAALQQAIDDGVEYLLLPTGVYHFNQPLILRNRIRALMGMKSSIMPIPGGGALRKQAPGGATIRIEGGHPEGVRIERLSVWADNEARICSVDHQASVPIWLESGRMEIRLNADTAPAFVSDVPCGGIEIHPGASLYALQFNPENRTVPKILNHGGTARILGLKTERGARILQQSDGGRCEILGGIHVGNWAYAEDATVYATRDSDFSASFSTKTYRGGEFKHLVDADEQLLRYDDERIRKGRLPPRVPLVSVRAHVPKVGKSGFTPFRSSEPSNRGLRSPLASPLAWFRADRGVEQNADGEVRRWQDLSERGEDLVMEALRDYSIETRPHVEPEGLRFQADVLLGSGSLILPQKQDLDLYLDFSPDPGRMERQVLWLQGDAKSGLSLYLEKGHLHAYAYQLEGGKAWGPVHVQIPLPQEARLRCRLKLDGRHLRLQLNDKERQAAAGALNGPKAYLRTSVGAAYSNATVHFPDWSRPKRVFGGQFFYYGLIHELAFQ